DGAGPGWICGCRISVPYIWIGYQNRPGRQQKRTWGQNAKVLAALKTLAPMEVFKNSCEIADKKRPVLASGGRQGGCPRLVLWDWQRVRQRRQASSDRHKGGF